LKHLEDDLQKMIFMWSKHYKQLDFMHAIPNGGKRSIREGARLKAQGVTSGVFDIYLPIAAHDYHGLYIELKIGKNKLTENQKLFKEYVVNNGYMAEVIYNFNDAIKLIKWYTSI